MNTGPQKHRRDDDKTVTAAHGILLAFVVAVLVVMFSLYTYLERRQPVDTRTLEPAPARKIDGIGN